MSNLKSIANPYIKPTLSLAVNGTSTLEAATYYVAYSYSSETGETMVSPVSAIKVTGGNNLVIGLPALPRGTETRVALYAGVKGDTFNNFTVKKFN